MYLFSEENSSLLPAIIVSSCLKILLLNSYHSTDFEVHRNWLAITFSLPLSEWYYEETSEWTLDYPPFFAWFEFALSHIAYYFDKEMLNIDNLNYASPFTVLFQRLSVIVGDIVLLYAVKKYCTLCVSNTNTNSFVTRKFFVFWAICLNIGLLLVDHIHFQYNGFLFGIFILSLDKMMEGKYLCSAFWFSILLNFKHIFVYIAPVYFVYLLRSYCFRRNGTSPRKLIILGANIHDFFISVLIKLGLVVVSIFTLSFGPFIYMGQMSQVLSRLFPVKRGLCHAYWAANFWAIYASFDKFLTIVGSKLGYIHGTKTASMTGGLVGQQEFTILWNIPPVMTLVLAATAMLPALYKLWCKPFLKHFFLPCLVLCAYASFLFGYHVHEKAVLMILIPMTFLAVESAMYARIYIILQVAGQFALFPLLPEQAETPIKLLLFLLFTIPTIAALGILHNTDNYTLGLPFVTWYEAFYIYGLIPLFMYTDLGHWALGHDKKLPFIPLLLTSIYCAVGVVWSWLLMYKEFLGQKEEVKKIN